MIFLKSIDLQDREEACIRRICKYFKWECCVAPNPKASNYEKIKLRPREYIALCSPEEHTTLRCLSSTRGSGHSTWLVFEDFLEWLDVVEWFSNNNWIHELNKLEYELWSVQNPFFNKHLSTIEEVDMFLDLIDDSIQ